VLNLLFFAHFCSIAAAQANAGSMRRRVARGFARNNTPIATTDTAAAMKNAQLPERKTP
jgi:hypothetical protein